MKRPIAVAGFSCLLTQLLAAFVPRTAMWLFAAFFLLLCFLLWCVRAKFWQGALIAACAICAALLLREVYFAARIEPAQALADTRSTVTAVVLETNASYAEDFSNVLLQITHHNGAPVSNGLKVQAERFPYTPPGEIVRFTANFYVPALGADARDAYEQGIWLMAHQVEHCEWLGAENTVQTIGLRVRSTVASTICTYWPSDIAAVACAMSIGEKSLLRTEVREAFRSAGLSHALVVSGLHLSVVCSFAFSALHVLLRRRYAALGAMVAAVLFAMVTGFTPSVLRAGVAMLLFYGAQFGGRQSDPLTSLGFAALVLCFLNPYAASNIGLLLSFAATLGVLAAGAWTDARRQQRKAVHEEALESGEAFIEATYEQAEHEKADADKRSAWAKRQGEKLLEACAVPVCTTLATLPVLAAAGMGVSLVGVLCNVLCVPLLAIIVPCGLILGCWNGSLLLEPIARVAGLFCGIGVQLVLWIANWANNFPWAVVTVSGAAAVVCILGAAVLIYVGMRRGLRLRYSLAVAALFILLAGGAYVWLDKDVARVAVVGSGTEPAIVITQRLHTAIVFRGGAGNVRAVQRWLQRNNRDKVDILVDLRRKGNAQELAQQLVATETIQAQALTNGVTIKTFCDIIITIGHQKNGNYAALELGGIGLDTSVGRVDLAAYTPSNVYVAGASQPEHLACETLLLPQKLPAWLKENMPAVQTRAIESELCLLVRRGKSMQWKGETP